ncbi:MAG: hypothetical protein GY810_24510 [Aureispira sp.]|nr:hypothetical protein [Aureispira sp.]
MFNSDEIQNLRQLLNANDLSSIELGLTLLQTQEKATIKTFKEELFLVNQFAPFLSPENNGQHLKSTTSKLIKYTLKGKALKAFNSLLLTRRWIHDSDVTRHILEKIHNTCFNPIRFAKKLYYFDPKLGYSYLLQYGDEDTQYDLLKKHINNNNLYLSSTNIHTIPKIIRRFKDIKSLVLSSMGLDKLPDEIAELKNLKILHIDNNHFKEVPKILYQLPSLKVLKLGANSPLQKLPSELYKLYTLTMLDLSGTNNFLNKEEAIGKMLQLQILNWRASPYSDYKKQKTFPICLSSLPNLISLDLSNHLISSLPNEIANLQELRNLYLTNNPIGQFPKPLMWMPKLKRLSITLGSGDEPTIIPPSIHQLSSLETLSLENCYFAQAPTRLAMLTQLKQLEVKNLYYKERGRYLKLDSTFFEKLLPNCKVVER